MRKKLIKKKPIDVIDVDLNSATGWSEALEPFVAGGQKLLHAFNKEGRGYVGHAAWWGLQRASGALHQVLGGKHEDEIADIAGALDVSPSEVVLANAAYDISSVGCTTIAAPSTKGPIHARNLDWPFPRGLLKKHVVVARMCNGAFGSYALVTFPGVFGALTGIAPGRFSIAVNFVTHAKDSSIKGLVKRSLAGFWPVAWAVRHAFDAAKSFEQAVRVLQEQFLLSPVLLTIVGTRLSDRLVIECGCDHYALRAGRPGRPLVVTNHFQSPELEEFNSGLDEMDTLERAESLQERLDGVNVTPASALRALSSGDVLSPNLQHQVVMQAATGRLIVRVPGRRTLDIRV